MEFEAWPSMEWEKKGMRKNSSLFSPAIPQAYLHRVRRLTLDGVV
jgi:hypothetical protein